MKIKNKWIRKVFEPPQHTEEIVYHRQWHSTLYSETGIEISEMIWNQGDPNNSADEKDMVNREEKKLRHERVTELNNKSSQCIISKIFLLLKDHI